jgi:hypothetical protein
VFVQLIVLRAHQLAVLLKGHFSFPALAFIKHSDNVVATFAGAEMLAC